jgi:hypothetical protein
LCYSFTEKLLHIFDIHPEQYWMISDLDGQTAFSGGREPDRLWPKKLKLPKYQLKPMTVV